MYDITTGGTTEYLSSTTGKSWWTEDGLVKRGEQVRAFVGTNYNNLLQRNGPRAAGIFICIFVTILGIFSHQEPLFQRLVQAPYTLLAEVPVSQGDHELNRFIRQVQLLSVHGPGEMVNG